MSILLPSGKSAVHNMLQPFDTLSPRPHSYWHLCVVRVSRDIVFDLSSNLPLQVLHYLTRTMKQVYAAHTRKVCLVCL
jgi:hypothetical protein